ncbi:hypothetical protein OS493_008253 [Desmophyllum pertusum]|uniref:Uncharacterized protein n=1 Tax=Desmophyllum pertusum TaxID=174260 RepID=A0A9X0A4Q4_9CNID|nr:hypothetical protein OS493_008253 [Desmophyllum pertusum]
MGKIVCLPNKNAFNNIREIKTSTESGRDVKAYPQYPQAGFSYSRYSPPSPPPRARDVNMYSPPRPQRVRSLSVPNRTTTRIQSQSHKATMDIDKPFECQLQLRPGIVQEERAI